MLDCGYIWDDDLRVYQNPTLLSLAGLRRIWFDVAANKQYYPLVFTSFWLEHQIWGFDPTGFHVVNVLLHGLAALLLWRLLAFLGLPGAWIAGWQRGLVARVTPASASLSANVQGSEASGLRRLPTHRPAFDHRPSG